MHSNLGVFPVSQEVGRTDSQSWGVSPSMRPLAAWLIGCLVDSSALNSILSSSETYSIFPDCLGLRWPGQEFSSQAQEPQQEGPQGPQEAGPQELHLCA